jgi:hypothetical protein
MVQIKLVLSHKEEIRFELPDELTTTQYLEIIRESEKVNGGKMEQYDEGEDEWFEVPLTMVLSNEEKYRFRGAQRNPR